MAILRRRGKLGTDLAIKRHPAIEGGAEEGEGGLLHLAIVGKGCGASRAAYDMVFDLARVPGVELAVNQRMK